MDRWDWTPFLATDDDTPEQAHRRWYSSGLIDGLPIIPPTLSRVRRLYREAGLDSATFVAVLEPSRLPVSVFDLAVCTVASGCSSHHLALLVGAVRAVCEPEFNLLGIQTTTGTATPIMLVHGPAAQAAGVSGGEDCLGGSSRANAALGRALRVVLRALGGGGPSGMDRATMGQPAKLGLCFAENYLASPWSPMHVALGLPAAASAVTVIGVSGSVEVVHPEDGEPQEILTTLAGSMMIQGTTGSHALLGGGSPLVVLSPEHAHRLDTDGLDRAGVQRELWRRAVLPVEALAPSVAARIRRGTSSEAASINHLRVAERHTDILIAVAGGVGVKSTYFPSWGGGTRAITVRL